MDELENWGKLDASDEARYTVAPGLEHKYQDTALFLVSKVCGSVCRFCFRKRIFMNLKQEVLQDYSCALTYIRKHPEITNILVTGGEPLLLNTNKLSRIVRELRDIDHVGIIRIGSKIPAFNPYRILDDPSLLDMISTYSRPEKRIYIMCHFNHPAELTDVAIEGVTKLLAAGAILTNQTPLIRGVNDDPEVLAELFRKLSFIGIPPYYIFQCRPTLGNHHFSVPIAEGFRIFEEARNKVSGLAKRARYVMSHATGKVEILAVTDEHIYLRYLRAANPENQSRFMIALRDDEAYWFDDLTEATSDISLAYM
jgi:KamA family protein